MKINTLELTNVRGFTHAKLEFQPGFNLIVGINGVGKTTVLESLRIVLSQILPNITVSKNQKDNFDEYDIQIDKSNLVVDSKFTFLDKTFSAVIPKNKESIKTNESDDFRNNAFKLDDKVTIENYIPAGTVSDETIDFTKVDFYQFGKENLKNKNQPLGIYFSSHRSLMNQEKPTKGQTAGGQASAYADALNNKRQFTIRLYADWMLAQEALAEEDLSIERKLSSIKNAIYTFIPEFSDLKVIKDHRGENNTFSVKKGEKEFSIQQLSDGERSIITLVLDIARRLTLANIALENPLEGEAIVLIDELDLHLHPKWQRTIVSDLVRTFPNCQFIATTHSPQIIGEVKAEAITIIDRNQEAEVYKPNVAYGLDAQRVIEELLEAPIRNIETQQKLEEINDSVDKEQYEEAKSKIEELKSTLGEHDPELIRINSMIQFLEEDFDDEEDN